MKVNGVDTVGTFLRYVDGSELGKCDVGQVLAVKDQVARVRVLRTFLGDYDVRGRNLLVAPNGTVFDIDHGQARITSGVADGSTDDETFDTVRHHMAACAGSAESPQALTRPDYLPVGAAERQVDYAQVQGLVDEIHAAMQRGDVERALRPISWGTDRQDHEGPAGSGRAAGAGVQGRQVPGRAATAGGGSASHLARRSLRDTERPRCVDHLSQSSA